MENDIIKSIFNYNLLLYILYLKQLISRQESTQAKVFTFLPTKFFAK